MVVERAIQSILTTASATQPPLLSSLPVNGIPLSRKEYNRVDNDGIAFAVDARPASLLAVGAQRQRHLQRRQISELLRGFLLQMQARKVR